MEENNHASSNIEYLTVARVQELFTVTRATVEGWLESGELPHYRLGPRTIRIARPDLDEFIAARRRATLLSARDIRSRCSAPEEGNATGDEAAA